MLVLAIRKVGRKRLTEPVINPEIWQSIPDQQIGPAEGATEVEQDGASQKEPKVGQQNQTLVLLLIQRAERVEVVDATITVLATDALTFRLLMMVVVASDIHDEIQRPSEDLLGNEVSCGEDWSLFEKLVHLVHEPAHFRGMLIPRAW